MTRPRRNFHKQLPPTLQELAAATLEELSQLAGFYPLQFAPWSKPNLTFGHRPWRLDSNIHHLAVRKRGERDKQAGAILIEEVAVNLLKERTAYYKPRFDRTGIARAEALMEIAGMFGISPDTLENWDRGVQRSERRKPVEKRSFRRRKKHNAD